MIRQQEVIMIGSLAKQNHYGPGNRIRTFQQPPSSADNKMWSDDETIAVLDIWGSDDIQYKLATIKRNRLVWEEIGRRMVAKGYRRSAKQCCGKIHNLKVEFRKVKTLKKENNFKFFDIMEPLMIGDVALANSGQPEAFEYRRETILRSPGAQARQDTSSGSNFAGNAFDDDQVPVNDDAELTSAISMVRESCRQQTDHDDERRELRSVKIENELSPSDEISSVNHEEGCQRTFNTASSAYYSYADKNVLYQSGNGINRGRKRRTCCHGAGLVDAGLLLDKLRQMQEDSDRRFYEWEEKRFRLEREFEERRQKLESEREGRRERFLIQMVSLLQRNEHSTDHIDNFNRSTQAIITEIPRTHGVITNSSFASKRIRTADNHGTSSRSAGGCV